MTMEKSKNLPQEPGKWRQFLAAIIVNLAALVYGTAIGWSSPTIPRLQRDDTPVGTEPLSEDQVSWLNSVMCLGGLSLLPFCSFISERLGRKITGCLIAIPYGLCWILTIFATNYTCLLVARVFAGMGGALCVFLVPLYISEIAADSIRGQLGSFMVFAINIGILLAYVVGAVVSYQVLAICALLVPLIFLGGFIFMPETPVYLVRKDRMMQATRSLMWLKNGDKSAADRELLRLQVIAKANLNNEKSVGIRDLFRDRGTIKGFVIALALLGGQQTCGISAVVTYTATIFELAGSSLSPNSATIIVGAIQVFGSWLSTIMMERAGRRPLILISCAGMAICHYVLSIFLYMQDKSYDVSSISWIPVAAMSVFAIVYCLGMGPAPFVVASEVFSPDISGLANSVAQVFMWLIAFVVVKFFPIFSAIFGMYGCFFLLGCCCVCTFLFTFFVVPETKGRTIESILDELNGCPKTLEENRYLKASVEVIEKHPSSLLV